MHSKSSLRVRVARYKETRSPSWVFSTDDTVGFCQPSICMFKVNQRQRTVNNDVAASSTWPRAEKREGHVFRDGYERPTWSPLTSRKNQKTLWWLVCLFFLMMANISFSVLEPEMPGPPGRKLYPFNRRSLNYCQFVNLNPPIQHQNLKRKKTKFSSYMFTLPDSYFDLPIYIKEIFIVNIFWTLLLPGPCS